MNKKIILGLFVFLFLLTSVSQIKAETPYYIDDDLNTWIPLNIPANESKILRIEKTGSNTPDFNQVFDDSLEAFYPFLGSAYDVSPNNYDGTVNGATLTTDRFGNPDSAYSFDGSEDNIIVSNPEEYIPGDSSFSIEFWYLSHNRDDWELPFEWPGGDRVYVGYNSKESSSLNRLGWNFMVKSNGNRVDTTDDKGLFPQTYTSWFFVQAVQDRTSDTTILRVYNLAEDTWDEVSVNTPSGETNPTGDLEIGSIDFPVKGIISDMRLWHKIRTQSEIEQLKLNPPTITVTDQGDYYEVEVTNPNDIDYDNYQMYLPSSDTGVTSTTDSLEITEVQPETYDIIFETTPSDIYVNTPTQSSCYINKNDYFEFGLDGWYDGINNTASATRTDTWSNTNNYSMYLQGGNSTTAFNYYMKNVSLANVDKIMFDINITSIYDAGGSDPYAISFDNPNFYINDTLEWSANTTGLFENVTIDVSGYNTDTILKFELKGASSDRSEAYVDNIRYIDETESSKKTNITMNVQYENSTIINSTEYNNVNPNQFYYFDYTITQQQAHQNLTYECIISDNESTITKTNNKYVLNTPPTTPDIYANDSAKVYQNITTICQNSTDIDGDNITYKYSYKIGSELLQNYSTQNYYTIQPEDAHQIITSHCYAYDDYDNSTSSINTTNTYVANTAPQLTNVKIYDDRTDNQTKIYYDSDIKLTYNIYDQDNDTIDVKYILTNPDGQTSVYSNEHNNTLLNQSHTDYITYQDESFGDNITFSFSLDDGYDTITPSQTLNRVLYYGYITFEQRDEATEELFDISVLDRKEIKLRYEDNSEETQTITNNQMSFDIKDELKDIEFLWGFPERNIYRTYVTEPGVKNYTAWVLNMINTPFISLSTYFLGLEENQNNRVTISTTSQGEISNQELDVSDKSDFALISDKNYYISLIYDDGRIRELGKISDTVSTERYFRLTEFVGESLRGNLEIDFGIEINNNTIKTNYNDPDLKTTYLNILILDENRTEICNFEYDTIYNNITSSCVVSPNANYYVEANYIRNSFNQTITRIIRDGEITNIPLDIPDFLLEYVPIFFILILFLIATIYNIQYINLTAVILLGIFRATGFITFPIPLILTLGIVSLTMIYMNRGAV